LRPYLLLALAALAATGDCLRGCFHFDDYSILANPAGRAWFLQTRPLTQLTFWLNYQAGATDPAGYHLVNLLLHVAVVCVLFQILLEYLPRETAFAASALFAIHPLQSEAVNYIFARSSLLGALFCLLCWRSWKGGHGWRSVAWFGCALLCKEECVTFTFVLVLLGPRLWKPIAAMLALAAVVGVHTVYATRAIAGSGAGFTAGISPLEYLANQGPVLIRYVRLFCVPWGFSVDPEIHNSLAIELLAWLAIALALVAFRKNRWLMAGTILLIPSSSIFPAADLAADRRTYLPMIAFCAAFATLVRRVPRLYLAPLGVLLIGLSIGRSEVWRTERSLWQEAHEQAPSKPRPTIQLARAVAPTEALEILRTAPATTDVLAERGRVYLDLGRPADALREFGRALALSPRDAHAVNNRGAALLALGQTAAARTDFERALSIDPTLPEAKQNLERVTAAAK
jgi:hypothetical protein